MEITIVPFLCSALIYVVLRALFAYERNRGSRFLEHVRSRIDFFVLSVTHALHRFFDTFSRDTMRQIMHYLLHIVLGVILFLNREWEKRIRNMIRANRAMARHAERDRDTRNKLEEIALHKMKVALSEDQKKQHKAKILEG